MTLSTEHDMSALPQFPGDREPRCPFAPPPAQAQWREQDGLQKAMWQDSPVWVVTRHEDVRAVLSDPRVSADLRRPDFPGWTSAAANQTPTFPRMDDPEHARLRRMLTKDFTVKRVDKARPGIQKIVEEYLEQMIRRGQPADLVRDFALPIPSVVISVLLGVPYDDHEFFQQHSHTVNDSSATAEEKDVAVGTLMRYLMDLVHRKENDPGDDLISRLVQEQVAAGELTRDAVAMTGIILLIAGHETTANMITLSTLALLQNPEQAARIRQTDDPALVANTVEELLRYLTIAHDMVARVATEDITLGGQTVRAGEGLLIGLPAANRDPRAFTDADELDLDRPNVRTHVAFGYGIHQCLGQSLARAELQIALPTLLRRLPDLRLATPADELRYRDDMSTYGVHALPVAW